MTSIVVGQKGSQPGESAYGCLLFGSALYLSLNLFSLRGVPFLLGGDQAYFWMRAMRMLGGQRIYQDFLQYTPPGTDLVHLLFFRLFGLRLWTAIPINPEYCGDRLDPLREYLHTAYLPVQSLPDGDTLWRRRE
jgi:hypothetical protein